MCAGIHVRGSSSDSAHSTAGRLPLQRHCGLGCTWVCVLGGSKQTNPHSVLLLKWNLSLTNSLSTSPTCVTKATSRRVIRSACNLLPNHTCKDKRLLLYMNGISSNPPIRQQTLVSTHGDLEHSNTRNASYLCSLDRHRIQNTKCFGHSWLR